MGYYGRRWVAEGFSVTPHWALGEEPGLLPGLVRVDPLEWIDSETRPAPSGSQVGGDISALRDPRLSKSGREAKLWVVRYGHGRHGRRHRTDGLKRAIRRYRSVIEQGGGDRWSNPDLEPEPEWDPDEEQCLRQVLRAWEGDYEGLDADDGGWEDWE